MKRKVIIYSILLVVGASISGFALMRSYRVQVFLLEWYAYNKSSGFDSEKVITYLSIAPFKNNRVSIVRIQGSPAQDVTMLNALLLCIGTDVGMTDDERVRIQQWIDNYYKSKHLTDGR